MDDASQSTPKHPVCAGIRRDGQRCAAAGMLDGFCYNHAPGREQERTEARRKGGRNRSNAARIRAAVPARLLPVLDQLEGALGDVLSGTLDPRQATAAAAVARALAAVLQAGELEERLRRLEEGAA